MDISSSSSLRSIRTAFIRPCVVIDSARAVLSNKGADNLRSRDLKKFRSDFRAAIAKRSCWFQLSNAIDNLFCFYEQLIKFGVYFWGLSASRVVSLVEAYDLLDRTYAALDDIEDFIDVDDKIAYAEFIDEVQSAENNFVHEMEAAVDELHAA